MSRLSDTTPATDGDQLASDRRAAESEVRAALELMPQLVWTTTPDGYHDYYNERWYEFTGMPRPGDPAADAEGWNWSTYLHPDDLARTVEVWTNCLRTGATYEIEYRFREKATGEYRWFLARALPMRDDAGTIVRWFGTCTDIDDQRRTTERLVAARAEAEAAARAKSEFLTVMSHELRTPLNAIGGYVQLLEMGLYGSVTDDQRDALRRIDRAQRHLLGLVNSVLNLSRLQAGNLHYRIEPVRVRDVVSELDPLIGPQLREKQLAYHVTLDHEAVVLADREKLLQVLLNLVSNAVKFTPPGGTITVERGRRTDGSEAPDVVFIRVRDDGIGIPEAKFEVIFEPFVQVDTSASGRAAGTGLGLAISRDLARGMGGDIRARSTLGEGSAFTLKLPRG